VVVSCVSKDDRHGNLPEGDGFLARDGSGVLLSWSWVSTSPSKVSRYMRLRPLPPSMRALVSRVVPTSRLTIRGNLLNFGTLFG
jgi:hypothetical protein